MKKDKTPKGLMSGELEVANYKSKAYWALVNYYQDITNKDDVSLSECRFIDILLGALRAVAENAKNREAKNGK